MYVRACTCDMATVAVSMMIVAVVVVAAECVCVRRARVCVRAYSERVYIQPVPKITWFESCKTNKKGARNFCKDKHSKPCLLVAFAG